MRSTHHAAILLTIPELIEVVLDEIRKTDEWIKNKPVEAAEKLSTHVGIDAKILEKALHRSNFGLEYIKPEVIAAQQKIADALFAIKLLPTQIKVEDAVWQPKK